MRRRTFLKRSMGEVGVLAGISYAGLTLGELNETSQRQAEQEGRPGEKVGRPVRITSISFPSSLSLDEIAAHVDNAGAANVDVIALPELCRGQNDRSEEDLQGPTVTAMAALARKHNTYIVCPIDRRKKDLRLNTVVLLDRSGNVACLYDKVFPYWSEYDAHPPVNVSEDALI